jgi:HEAT repeat protein/beta-lactamase regulating signal transducer with metallopeptidase domain
MMLASLVFIKASIVVLVALLASFLARRASAATRSALWWAALAMLLALPLGRLVLPQWTPVPAGLRVPSDYEIQMVARPADAGVRTSNYATPNEPTGHTALAAPRRASRSAIVTAQRLARRAAPWLGALWIVGAAASITGLVLGVRRSRSLRRAALAAPARVQRLTLVAARRLGLVRVPRVVLCPDLAVPAQGGIRSPVVMLPADAIAWDDDRLSAVLLHELAHVTRRDLLLHVLGRLVVALYWPNPLVHFALRRASLETERACDDTVLRAGTPQADYAGHLAAVAALMQGQRTGTALAMARPSTLLVRVRAILDGRSDRRATTRRFMFATAAGAACVALLVGASAPSGDETQAAIAALGSETATVRRAGAWRIGRLELAAGARALEQRLTDTDPEVRGVAAWALGRLGSRRAVPALIELAGDADATVREMTSLALGTIGDERATGALARLAHDSVWSVRAVTTRSLQLLGTEAAGDVLAELAASEPEEHARSMAIWALQEIGTRATPAGLLRALQHPSVSTRHDALSTLRRLGGQEHLGALMRTMSSDSVESIRGHAAAVLCDLGDETVVPALVQAARDTSWHVRVAAICGLGKFGGPAASAALLVALRDSVHQVRLSAVEALNDGFVN